MWDHGLRCVQFSRAPSCKPHAAESRYAGMTTRLEKIICDIRQKSYLPGLLRCCEVGDSNEAFLQINLRFREQTILRNKKIKKLHSVMSFRLLIINYKCMLVSRLLATSELEEQPDQWFWQGQYLDNEWSAALGVKWNPHIRLHCSKSEQQQLQI